MKTIPSAVLLLAAFCASCASVAQVAPPPPALAQAAKAPLLARSSDTSDKAGKPWSPPTCTPKASTAGCGRGALLRVGGQAMPVVIPAGGMISFQE